MNKERMTTSSLLLILSLVLAWATACRQEVAELQKQTPVTVEEPSTDPITEQSPAAGAEQTPADDESEAVSEPVTLNLVRSSPIPTLDPQTASDTLSIGMIHRLFVPLIEQNRATGELFPAAATAWEISPDGRVYTFTLRSDIPWVYHDPTTGVTAQVMDNEGQPRLVTAHDFAYAARRACHPQVGGYYGGILGRVISGCQTLLESEPEEGVELPLDAVGVRAPDETTLVFELITPAGYFLPMSSLWTLSAVPSWTIEEHGAGWTEAGNIVTNGPYVLAEWTRDTRDRMVRNPFFPDALRGQGNIEEVVSTVVPDVNTAYALWLQGEVDLVPVPDGEVETHLQAYPQQTVLDPGGGVFYVGFVSTKPPFDDAQVRRAFSAAIDRQTLAEDVIPEPARPMIHFTPPGNFGAPPIDEVGIGFDPAFARAELAEAGYPDCEGFPRVTLLGFAGPDLLAVIEFLQGQWQEHLGCPAGLIQIEQQPFADMLAATAASQPIEDVPHMYTLGWGHDYLDANNWLGDVLWCGNEGTRSRRSCTEVDDWIVEAGHAADPDRRIALYRQIEEAFFGPEGEMPIAPLYQGQGWVTFQEWLALTPSLLLQGVDDWTLDWQAKQATQE